MADRHSVIVAHDVGTSGVKTVLTDLDGRRLATHLETYPSLRFPRPGWVEQDAEDWWRAICRGTRAVTRDLPGGAVACLTFSTQMMTLVPLSAGGEVVRPPLSWLDGRAGDQARAVMRRFGGRRLFGRLAGATLSGKDGIPKLRWLRDREPDTWRRMACFVDTNGYLLLRATGRIAMEWSGAAAFGFDLKGKRWMEGVFRYSGIDPAKLPPLVRSIDTVGGATAGAASELGVSEGTPIVAGMGDVPAAAIGAGAVRDGDGHLYLGTSGWIGVLTRRHPTGRHGVAVIQSGDPERNLLVGETESGGQCVGWIAANLYPARDRGGATQGDGTGSDGAGGDGEPASAAYAEMDRDAAGVPPGSSSLLFTPWMAGERVPVTDLALRAGFLNLGLEHRREHLVRSVFEGVSLNLRWTLERFERDFQMAPQELRVVGGGARSPVWMQILADVTGRWVETVTDPQDAGAVGAALGAGVALGIHQDFADLRSVVSVGATYEPNPDNRAVYDALYLEYRHAYRRLRGLYHELNERPVA